jgi:hypothetical protein
MAFFHLANGTGLNQLHYTPVIFCGMNLRAHLGGQPVVFRSKPGNGTGLKNGVGERLFAVNMFSQTERRRSGNRVRVVRGADYNSVQVLLFEQSAKIIVSLGTGKFLAGGSEEFIVDIAQRCDVLMFDAGHVRSSAIGSADNPEVQLFVGGNSSSSKSLTAGKTGSGGRERSQVKELPA